MILLSFIFSEICDPHVGQDHPLAGSLGMTWAVLPKPELGEGAEDDGNIVGVGCGGFPRRNTIDNKGACKTYTGDTPCTECLPILCLKPENLPRPNYGVSCTGHAVPWPAFYCGWSGGYVGLTRPVQGKDKEIRKTKNVTTSYIFLYYYIVFLSTGFSSRGTARDRLQFFKA